MAIVSFVLIGLAACEKEKPEGPSTRQKVTTHYQKWANPRLDTLADLSIEALRNRPYGSVIKIESRLDSANDETGYSKSFSADGSPIYTSYMTSYQSDGNRVYSRIDIPSSPPPEDGYPLMVFVHGWVGLQDAPTFDFGYKADSLYSRYVDAFVDAGYVVLTPGWRGHGTVNGIQAEGYEFMETWDNGSYISPMFYAIDVLNLIEGIQTIENIDWVHWGIEETETPRINHRKIHVTGYSQGGDSALTVMAVSGENSTLKNSVFSGSLWSGCFGTRFAQAGIYGPMASTLEAFMSGDGTWTGSAEGRDGSINPNFVFAWPPDWIGTLDTNSPDWSWQVDSWKLKTVAESLEIKFSEMYNAINKNVENINDASFKIEQDNYGKSIVRHDPRIVEAMHRISAFNYEQYLTEPLLFHHSDQDYYSIPEWNAELSARINSSGGNSHDFIYPENTHSLLISKHEWFSKKGAREGFETMISHDLSLLDNGDAELTPTP